TQPDRSPGVHRIGQPSIGRCEGLDGLRAPHRREIARRQGQIVRSKTGSKTGPHGLPPDCRRTDIVRLAAGLRPRACSLNRNHLLTLTLSVKVYAGKKTLSACQYEENYKSAVTRSYLQFHGDTYSI